MNISSIYLRLFVFEYCYKIRKLLFYVRIPTRFCQNVYHNIDELYETFYTGERESSGWPRSRHSPNFAGKLQKGHVGTTGLSVSMVIVVAMRIFSLSVRGQTAPEIFLRHIDSNISQTAEFLTDQLKYHIIM